MWPCKPSARELERIQNLRNHAQTLLDRTKAEAFGPTPTDIIYGSIRVDKKGGSVEVSSGNRRIRFAITPIDSQAREIQIEQLEP